MVQGLLEILSAASEFDELPLRPGEEDAVRRLLLHAPVAVDKPRFTDPHVKANALLQVWRRKCACVSYDVHCHVAHNVTKLRKTSESLSNAPLACNAQHTTFLACQNGCDKASLAMLDWLDCRCSCRRTSRGCRFRGRWYPTSQTCCSRRHACSRCAAVSNVAMSAGQFVCRQSLQPRYLLFAGDADLCGGATFPSSCCAPKPQHARIYMTAS